MGAVRLDANIGLGIGGSIRIVRSKLCCWVFGLGGALGCNETLIVGDGLFVIGKGRKVTFEARGTK